MTLRPPVRTFLLLALALAAAPLHADDGAAPATPDAQQLAFEGQLDTAIEVAQGAFASAPTAEAGRLLQDLLKAAGREEVWVVPDATPDLVRQGLEARRLEPKAAVAALDALVDVEGAPAVFQIDLAYALLDLGRYSTARTAAERYLKAWPESAEGQLALARILLASNKASLALKAFARVLELHPGHPPATVERAALLTAEGEPGAHEVLVAALALYPGNASLRLGLATEQVRSGELEVATGTLEALLTMAGRKAGVHVLLAEVWRGRRDYEKSAASAAAALADASLTTSERVRALRAQAFAKQKKDDLAGAREDFTEAMLLDPESAGLLADLGFVLALDGKHEQADEIFERALKIDKKRLDVRLKYGIARYLAGDARKARRELESVLKDDVNSIPANRIMGYLLLDEGKADKAMKHFRVVADLDATDSSSLRMIGRCLMALGQLPKAVQTFRDAVDRNPKDGWAHFDLGRGLEEQEMFVDAEAAYLQAIEVDPNLSHAHLYLAELRDFELDKPKEALAPYKRFLELGGRDDDGAIANRIEQLES